MRDRSLNPSADAALDRELARALAVEPSAHFVARVRQRIASEPPPLRWTVASGFSRTVGAFNGWWLAGAAVAAAAIVAALVVRTPGQPMRTAPLQARAVPDIEVPFVASGFSRTTSGFSRTTSGRVTAAQTAAVSRPEADVLIDRREARAMFAFLDGLEAGRIDPVVVGLATLPSADTDSTPDIHIAPIVIDPLAPSTAPEGASR